MPPAPDTRCLGGRPVHALGADGQPGEPGPPVLCRHKRMRQLEARVRPVRLFLGGSCAQHGSARGGLLRLLGGQRGSLGRHGRPRVRPVRRLARLRVRARLRIVCDESGCQLLAQLHGSPPSGTYPVPGATRCYAVPLPPWPTQRSGSHGMGGEPSMRVMSAPALSGEGARSGLATARPYLLGGVASLSVGAAAIHFAVMFEHFEEYTLYGVVFLVVDLAQMI